MDTVDYSEEVWKDIAGFELIYKVSNQGRIMRVGAAKGTQVGRILRHQTNGHGYAAVHLHKGNVRTAAVIHILVANAFLPPRPTPKHEVNHIDTNRFNPRVENLEWMTRKENLNYASSLGRTARGERHGMAKLSEADVVAIRKALGYGVLGKYLAIAYKVSTGQISLIKNRKKWIHL